MYSITRLILMLSVYNEPADVSVTIESEDAYQQF